MTVVVVCAGVVVWVVTGAWKPCGFHAGVHVYSLPSSVSVMALRFESDVVADGFHSRCL
ncbi:MAG: hypothetical protein ABSA81_08695 [Candidatus Bathyarchaeia archaeon]